jgi:hypothetical protein
MSYRNERYYGRRRRNRNGCLLALVIVVWVALIAVLAYRFWLRPQVSQYVGGQIGGQLNQPVEQGAASSLPTAIAALPTGELRITEAQANDYLASRASSLKPLDSVTVRFVPDEVQANLKALGTTSTATLGLAVQNNRIIAVNPQLEGPLGQFIALPELTRSLEKQLNDQLALQGRKITAVRVEQGAIVINVEG